MFDAVTVGSATKDLFLFVKNVNIKPGLNTHFLEMPYDKKIEVSKIMEFTGGSATNAAASFANFGKSCAVVSKIGIDSAADFILNDLKSRDINTDYIIRENGETPFTTVVVPKENEMVLLVYRGREATINPLKIKFDFKSKWAYIGPMPRGAYDTLLAVIKYCKENDIRVALNPGSTELDMGIKNMVSVLNDVDIISMNDDEAKHFVGYANDIKNLIKIGMLTKSMAIITKGENGSLVFDKKTIFTAEAFKSKQINLVGAGDAYFSGFINALMDEKGIEEAINLGSYNASKVVEHYGAKDGLVNKYPDKKLRIRRTKYEK